MMKTRAVPVRIIGLPLPRVKCELRVKIKLGLALR